MGYYVSVGRLAGGIAMWVEQVPVDWMMSHYRFWFSQRAPAPEDAAVLAYLAEHRLEPRTRGIEEAEGEPFEVWSFGECYLGPHLYRITDLLRERAESGAG